MASWIMPNYVSSLHEKGLVVRSGPFMKEEGGLAPIGQFRLRSIRRRVGRLVSLTGGKIMRRA
jgi:hypothetical protein